MWSLFQTIWIRCNHNPCSFPPFSLTSKLSGLWSESPEVYSHGMALHGCWDYLRSESPIFCTFLFYWSCFWNNMFTLNMDRIETTKNNTQWIFGLKSCAGNGSGDPGFLGCFSQPSWCVVWERRLTWALVALNLLCDCSQGLPQPGTLIVILLLYVISFLSYLPTVCGWALNFKLMLCFSFWH